MKPLRGLQYAAAATTIITGVLQLILSSSLRSLEKGDPTLEIFFIGIGILQLFWAIGIIRNWGKQFYSLANGITIALIFLWVLLRLPKPIIGAALPIDSLSIAIQALQLLFFALCTTILTAREEQKPITPPSSTAPALKTNITNGVHITPRYSTMPSRMVVLGIGAAVIIIGLAGITIYMSQVVKEYGVQPTSTPPYTALPPLPISASVYAEIAFVIIFIAGLFIASYGATLPGRSVRPEIDQ
ncbi:MAG TPA: hypothetical protein VEH06_07460 [Candidatus Bathyarchaeia archaeon]|jgi:hypothetical protein|nr:hypothetical protein [Candidatus Bathyarchaeia archaeon]